ncbi:MAG: tetratricopeptide repeat protein [Chloroflexi bacterium]|nr:tetratricopeptide repeat protein [Chloroflexota bacterium]
MVTKRTYLLIVTLLLILTAMVTGCDSNRNQLIRGFFYTQTPIPPTATPTLVPTQTPTPMPTPPPEYRITRGEYLLQIGDYDQSAHVFNATLDENPAEPIRAAAIHGLALIDYKKQDYESCQNRLIDGLNEISADESRMELWFLMADCTRELGLAEEEINALTEYMKLNPNTQLKDEIYERIGDASYKIGSYETARDAYLEVTNEKSVNAVSSVWMKIADSYIGLKDQTSAIQTWLTVYEQTTDNAQKARVDYLLAQTYLDLDSPDQAYARFQDAVNNYPQSYDSYASLLALINAAQPVNEYQRGLINYYRGQYALASEAFYRLMDNDPLHDGSAWYFIGVCDMYLANYEKAIESFNNLINRFPENQYYADAWDEKSYISWYYLGNFGTGAQTLLDYVKKHPDQPSAPKFLYMAGRILERGDRLTDAANQWERLIDEYPLYEQSQEALFQAALARYRAKSYDSALASFNRLLLVSSIPGDIARAHYWIAKVYEKLGSNADAQKNYQLAAEDSPTDFYTERAKDVLANREPFEFANAYDLKVDLVQARAVADQWIRLTFSLDDSVRLDQPEELLQDASYLKANELWRNGYFSRALNEFENLRIKYNDDAINSYRLLNRMIDLGAWRPAVYTSRQILTLAGLKEDIRTLEAPNYFNLIRYGTWYNEIVESVSADFNIHPFILYGLMRQESMYDPWIASHAGAQGLMQIMPATAKELAEKLKWPTDYTEADLLRAVVAVTFSGSFLSTQRSYFSNNDVYMLASYNGGAGNTTGWIDLAGGDIDLFIELIRFEETRIYIRHVYEFARMYERFYSIPN